MPIYEFKCLSCQKKFEFLVVNLKNYNEKKVVCVYCQSKKVSRIISKIILQKTEKQRLKEVDLAKTKSEDYYKDPHNVGLWAKKKAKEMGVDLGDAFEEKVEKARSGKILE